MEKVTKPTVKILASGSKLIAKQMQANAGELLPTHLANTESILLIQEGECILTINGKEHLLKQGDAIVVPPEIKHQIKVNKDFKAVHFMPSEIKFKFFDQFQLGFYSRNDIQVSHDGIVSGNEKFFDTRLCVTIYQVKDGYGNKTMLITDTLQFREQLSVEDFEYG